jgi:hypothetical protein
VGLRPTPRRAVRAVLLLFVLLGCDACRTPARVHVSAPATASATYDALGSGHRLRAVSQDGRYVTLEDGSRWEIHPRDRFRTIDWEADASISVRTTRAEDGYAYEIVNTSDDDGVMARVIAAR